MFPAAAYACVEHLVERWRQSERICLHAQWVMDNEQRDAEIFLAGKQWTPAQLLSLRERDATHQRFIPQSRVV